MTFYFVPHDTGHIRLTHVAAAQNKDEILLQGNYETRCGVRVGASNYRLEEKRPKQPSLCRNCAKR